MVSEGFWTSRVPGVMSGGRDPGAGIPEKLGRIPREFFLLAEKLGRIPREFLPLAEKSPGVSGEAPGNIPGN